MPRPEKKRKKKKQRTARRKITARGKKRPVRAAVVPADPVAEAIDANKTALLPEHEKRIRESAVSAEVAAERGYRTVTKAAELERLGFGTAQRRVPALLVPVPVPARAATHASAPATFARAS